MYVNLEVKGQLAKLLATENLIVEHRNVETAQFDVQKRVLTLPNWKRASNQVFDLLVAHEVGHALYTPNEDWRKKCNVPMQFLNVTEDVRVEKLMKRKFGGLRKTFYKGYNHLAEEDFFSIGDEDVGEMNLADRANLYFKIGNFVTIPFFNQEESDIIKIIEDAETFEDAIDAAKKLYRYCKDQHKKQQEDQQKPTNQGSPQASVDGQPQSESIQIDSEEDSEESQEQVETSDNTAGGNVQSLSDSADAESSEPEVKTQSELDEQLKDLIGYGGHDNKYIEIPNLDLDKVIHSHQEVLADLNYHFSVFDEEAFQNSDRLYHEFCKSSTKEVNYMVKEFECKKSAAAYARATTSRTGVLDCTKLHTYKYNEDLFKKVTILPDGKNHGLVFVLDWSGSMGEVILDTVKQVLNLISFCRKVKIPFELYAFINSFACDHEDRWMSPLVENTVVFFKEFKMLNLISSEAKTKELDKQMLNLYRMAYSFRYYVEYSVPPSYGLCGTPLNNAIVTLHQIIPHFQNKTGVEKVNAIILTDGESAPIVSSVCIPAEQSIYSKDYWGVSPVNDRTYLRNRKTGHVTQMGSYSDQTSNLIKDLSETFPNTNIIGIRLVSGRDFSNFQRDWVAWEDRERVTKQWRKDKSVVIKKVGFDVFFAIACNSLNNSVEFDVEESASKTQIRNAFKKSLSSKALNKKILTEFISIIA